MFIKSFKKLGIFLILFAVSNISNALPLYGASFGISLENIVTVGSLVNVHASVKNAGSEAIHFSPQYGVEPYTYEHGSNIVLGVGADLDWNILMNGFDFGANLGGFADLYQQFQGATINTDESFDFIAFSFLVPNSQQLGSVTHSTIDFELEFNKLFVGNLVWLDEHRKNIIYFNVPTISFIVGDAESSSEKVFFDTLVLNSDHYKFDVPEPSPLIILMLAIVMLLYRRTKNNSN